MDIIHADADRNEIGFIRDFKKFDAEISQTPKLDRNQFVLTMDEDDYLESGITDEDFVYIPFSEFGGQVDEIKHASKQGQVTISGATWRGLLCRKIVEPPTGAPYLTISKTEPNKALKMLIGDRFGDFFDVGGEEIKDAVVSGEFRFQTLLDAIVSSFSDARLEISCIYDNIQKKVRVFPRMVSDYSSLVDLSQDYGVHMTTKLGGVSTYNHIIALGRGELTEREVVHLYRLENGTITETSPGNLGLADRVTTFDYPNAESRDELIKSAKKQLEALAPMRSIEMDTSEMGVSLELGDLVSGRDRVTGLVTTKAISNVILTIAASGEKLETKVG